VRSSARAKVRDLLWSNIASPKSNAADEAPGVNFSSLVNLDQDVTSESSVRQVGRGMIDTPCRVEVHLRFEGFPIWLLSLESTLVSRVVIMSTLFKSMRTQGLSQDLVRAALQNVGLDQVAYSANETLPTAAVFLVSGSISFVKNWNRKVPNPMLVLSNEHIHNR
jgi:hypothetical protein